MSKKIKDLELQALRSTLGGVRDFVALEPMKVDSATDYEFRKKLRAKDIKVKMVKNSFAKKVFADGGIQTDSTWSGSTLLCWGGDSVKTLATSVDQAVKEAKKDPKSPEKFKVKTAVADGQVVTFEVAKTLPTRKEAIGDLLSAILGPGAALAGCLVGPANQLAGSLTPWSSQTQTRPGAMAQTKSGRHPYLGRMTVERSAATTYPTDQPAWSMPSTVVRIFAGTYSAASTFPML